MEMMIFFIADLVAKSKSPLAALLWMALIGGFVLLPSLFNFLSRYCRDQSIEHITVALGLAPAFLLANAPLIRLISRSVDPDTYWHCSAFFLHLLAFCLVIVWIRLQALQVQQQGSKENVSEVVQDMTRRDWITIVRLALWLTLSIMPIIKWS